MQKVCFPFSLALARLGSRRAARMAMIAITTSSSISVNAAHGRDFIWPMVVFWLICAKKRAQTGPIDVLWKVRADDLADEEMAGVIGMNAVSAIVGGIE